MIAAFGWGALGASALLFGALIAYRLGPSRGVIAIVMALGTGLLIGSVTFELIDEALKTSTVAFVGLLLLIGAAVFTAGDLAIRRRGGGERTDPTGAQAQGSPLAVGLGDRARLGPGRHPGGVRTRPDHSARRRQRVVVGGCDPLEPA